MSMPLRTNSTKARSPPLAEMPEIKRSNSSSAALGSKFKGLFIKSPRSQPESPQSVPHIDRSPSPLSSPRTRPLPSIQDEELDPVGEILRSVRSGEKAVGKTSSPPSRQPSHKATRTRTNSVVPPGAHREGTLLTLVDGTHQHQIINHHKAEKVTGGGLLGFMKGAKPVESYSLLDEDDIAYRLSRDSDTDEYTDDEDQESGEYASESEEESAIGEKQVRLIRKLTSKIETPFPPNPSAVKSLTSIYGKCQGIVGRGAYGIVKVVSKEHCSVTAQQQRSGQFYAVKELKRKSNEDIHHFSNRLTSEFCISSTLNHQNVSFTLNLMRDVTDTISVVLPLCAGGDLYNLISTSEGLDVTTSECFFKQLLRGIKYMHAHGIAHCDIKPENILLTSTGCLKITDFGTACVFRTAWEHKVVLSSGACGSEPYVAPEEYVLDEYDPRHADVWSAGIVYMTMRTGSYLWRIAKSSDELYSQYLKARPQYESRKCVLRGRFEAIEALPGGSVPKERRKILYAMLNPDPSFRWTAREVLKSEWLRSIDVCEAGSGEYE